MMSTPKQRHSNDTDAFPLLASRLRELQGALFNLGELMNCLEANTFQVQRDNTVHHRIGAINLIDLSNWIEATKNVVKYVNWEGNQLICKDLAKANHNAAHHQHTQRCDQNQREHGTSSRN